MSDSRLESANTFRAASSYRISRCQRFVVIRMRSLTASTGRIAWGGRYLAASRSDQMLPHHSSASAVAMGTRLSPEVLRTSDPLTGLSI